MNSESRPAAQSPSEIQDRLSKHLREGTPCEVLYEHHNEICLAECFVASIHSDFIVFGRIYQSSWLNGWRALRLERVIRINPTEDTQFTLRAMVANRIEMPLLSPIHSATFQLFLRNVCQTFPIITTDDDPALAHPSAAGTILEVNPKAISIRAMSTQGFWEPELHTIELKHITHVLFGSKYERTLERMAGMPDSNPDGSRNA